MNKKKFLQLVADKEGLTIEFKEQFSSAIARDLVAMANTIGGYLLLGISDKGELKGITQANRLLAQIQNLAHSCSPSLSVQPQLFRIMKKEFVAIMIPSGSNKPYSCSDGFFIRSGASTQKLMRDEVVGFLNREGHVKFEALSDERFNPRKHFNLNAYRGFLKTAGLSSRISRTELLQNLSLAKTKSSKLLFTKAGVLFFALEPGDFIPQNELTCVLYKGTDKVQVLERKDLKSNLFDIAEQTMLFLKRNLANEYEIKSLHRKEIWDVPLSALREAVLNALIHRDYAETGASILVEIFDNRVSISNPGGWPPGLTAKNFGTLSIRRNPVIADIFHRTGAAEKIGSGIKRMKEHCQKNGNPTPRFEFSDHFFIAEFPKRGLTSKAHNRQVPAKYPTSTRQVTDKLKLLSYCVEARKVKEIMAILGLKDRETFMNNYLRSLIKKKLLTMTIPATPQNPKQRYLTTPKGLKFLEQQN